MRIISRAASRYVSTVVPVLNTSQDTRQATTLYLFADTCKGLQVVPGMSWPVPDGL